MLGSRQKPGKEGSMVSSVIIRARSLLSAFSTQKYHGEFFQRSCRLLMMKYGKRKTFATSVPMQIYNECFFISRERRQESLCNMCSGLTSTTHASSSGQKEIKVRCPWWL